MAFVLNWNGKELPEELRAMPSGRYVLEPVDVIDPLTEEEDAGLHEALESLNRGEGAPADAVFRRLRDSSRR